MQVEYFENIFSVKIFAGNLQDNAQFWRNVELECMSCDKDEEEKCDTMLCILLYI